MPTKEQGQWIRMGEEHTEQVYAHVSLLCMYVQVYTHTGRSRHLMYIRSIKVRFVERQYVRIGEEERVCEVGKSKNGRG